MRKNLTFILAIATLGTASMASALNLGIVGDSFVSISSQPINVQTNTNVSANANTNNNASINGNVSPVVNTATNVSTTGTATVGGNATVTGDSFIGVSERIELQLKDAVNSFLSIKIATSSRDTQTTVKLKQEVQNYISLKLDALLKLLDLKMKLDADAHATTSAHVN